MVIEIHSDSEAGKHLAAIYGMEGTHTVRLDTRAGNKVVIKRNEGMWTAPLDTGSMRPSNCDATFYRGDAFTALPWTCNRPHNHTGEHRHWKADGSRYVSESGSGTVTTD